MTNRGRVFVACVLASIVVAAQSGQIRGAGATSCGTWLKERKTNDWYATLHWLQGYLSAYNQFVDTSNNPNGIFGDTDAHAIASWMDKYCTQHPLSNVYDGTPELIRELEARLKKNER